MDLYTCKICGAAITTGHMKEHIDWHKSLNKRIIDANLDPIY